jgi:hypothetical protein
MPDSTGGYAALMRANDDGCLRKGMADTGRAALPMALQRRCLLRQLLGLFGAAGLTGLAVPAAAERLTPLCGSAPPPAYPAADKPALVQSWLQDGRQDGPLPDCSGLKSHDFELLVRLTASYLAPGDLETQLGHFGAVSKLKGASYWSYSDRKRLVLFPEAYAVDHPGTLKPRADYSVAELRSGNELYFAHSDNRSSTLAPYSLRLLQSSAESFQVQVENVSDLRYLGMTLVAHHDMQWAVAIERLGGGRWGYRSLLGMRHLHLGRAEQHRLSNLARCVAMFDLLAGRHTDIEGYR